jgi:hypothetical protein
MGLCRCAATGRDIVTELSSIFDLNKKAAEELR